MDGSDRDRAAVTAERREPTDAELMTATRAGDRAAFARLVERHADRLHSYLVRLTGSPESAEDLAQETFLRLYRAAGRDVGRYRERGELTGYLYAIATNLARSARRRERRWRLLHPLLAASTRSTVGPVARERLLGRELEGRLEAAIRNLSPKLREALVLHEIEGLPVAEVARVLGCREGTVKSRLHRARRRLEQSLEPYREGASHVTPRTPRATEIPP